jgi:RNA polymerase sigma factor for flagellar operon FliA
MSEIKNILNSAKERDPVAEKRLWNDYREAPEAPEREKNLVEYYLPLVIRVASKMPLSVRNRISVEELVGSGVIGLHEAVANYRENDNARFSTFAYKRIKGAILDDLRSQDHLTRTQRGYYREICSAINRLTRKYSRPPTDQEIAGETGLSIYEIDRYIGMGSEMVNLNDEFREGLSYMEVLPDSRFPAPDESAHKAMALEKLREYFRELDTREQKILFLKNYEEMSVKEIAKVLEISEGRISQIYQKIVLKLKAMMITGETGK